MENQIKTSDERIEMDAIEWASKNRTTIEQSFLESMDVARLAYKAGSESKYKLLERAFIAGRSKTSWEQFQEDEKIKS